jgi:hypothetical protein
MGGKSRPSKGSLHVMTITAGMRFDADKPRYNGFGCGHGAHGSRGYDRGAAKREHARSLRFDW